MRIFNENKTVELTEYDESLGYLKEDFIETETPMQKAVEEKWHYEVIAEYKNGGKDVKKIVDVEGKPFVETHTEREEILVYIPYTEAELERRNAEQEIAELKAKLRDTDYQAIKYAEGELSEDEYAPTKAERRAWREKINQLECEMGGRV